MSKLVIFAHVYAAAIPRAPILFVVCHGESPFQKTRRLQRVCQRQKQKRCPEGRRSVNKSGCVYACLRRRVTPNAASATLISAREPGSGTERPIASAWIIRSPLETNRKAVGSAISNPKLS